MQNPNNFEEARAATEAMMAEEAEPMNTEETGGQAESSAGTDSLTPEPVQDATQEPTQEQPQEQGALEEAAETAETAAKVAAEKDGQLQQALAEIEMLKQQNQQMQGTIAELSERNEENIIQDVLEPPVLDLNGLAFASEEEQREAMAKYAEDLSAFNKKQFMDEISPAIAFAKKGMYEAEKNEVLQALSQLPELSGIQERIPQLDRIIQNNKWLSSDDMPMDEKYINAYAMAKGIDSINQPPVQKEPSAEEMLEFYNKSPELQALIEKQRLEAIKPSQQVPPLSGSSGAVNAALDIKEAPKTLEEASERTRRMFGGM